MLTRDWLGEDWQTKKAEIEAAGGSFVAVVSEALAAAAAGAGIQASLFEREGESLLEVPPVKASDLRPKSGRVQ